MKHLAIIGALFGASSATADVAYWTAEIDGENVTLAAEFDPRSGSMFGVGVEFVASLSDVPGEFYLGGEIYVAPPEPTEFDLLKAEIAEIRALIEGKD